MNKKSVKRKLTFIFFLKIIVGNLLLFLIDTIMGLIILFSAVLTLMWIKKVEETTDLEKTISQFHLLIGCILILGAIILFFIENEADFKVVIKSCIGSILIFLGSFKLIKNKNKLNF